MARPGFKGICPRDVRVRRTDVVVKVSRSILSNQPRGWLSAWTDELERQGCIAPGAAFRLANDIATSVPLDTNGAFHLLYPSDPDVVEIGPSVQLQIMTPILAEGATPDAPLVEVTTVAGNGTSLNLEARFTQSVLGYEMTWYSVQPRSLLPGVSVTPLATDRHINGQTERVSVPIRNYFESMTGTGFFGLFYKGGQTEFTALIVGGITKADLDRRIKLLETGPASCEVLNNERCVAVPKRAAVNPMVPVKVNGEDKLIQWGATVGSAIATGGQQRPMDVLAQLHVWKLYRDRLLPVEFKPPDSTILDLVLMGGESISWK